MDKIIHLSSPLKLLAEGGGDQADVKMTGIAYTGDAVTTWYGRTVIDLASLSIETPMPMLHGHKPDADIGVIREMANDGRQLAIEDALLFASVDDQARNIAEKARRGMPYQLSIGVHDASEESVPSGKEITVNGRSFQGPITIIRNGVLRETSIVPLGADKNTRADIAANLNSHPDGDPVMPDNNTPQPDNTGDLVVQLNARITELQQALEVEKSRADQAEQALADMRRAIRLNAVRSLLTDVGIEFSDQAAAPYLEMSEEQFQAIAEHMRKSVNANASQPQPLFDDVGGGQGDKPTVALSYAKIYAKRRTA